MYMVNLLHTALVVNHSVHISFLNLTLSVYSNCCVFKHAYTSNVSSHSSCSVILLSSVKNIMRITSPSRECMLTVVNVPFQSLEISTFSVTKTSIPNTKINIGLHSARYTLSITPLQLLTSLNKNRKLGPGEVSGGNRVISEHKVTNSHKLFRSWSQQELHCLTFTQWRG